MSRSAARSVFWLSLVLGLAPSANASEVSGQMVLGALQVAPEASAKFRSYWEIDNGVKELRKDRVDAPRELAVVLLGQGDAPALSKVEAEFSGGSVMPSTLIIRAGSTLQLTNLDEVAHELFAEGLPAVGPEATSPRGRRAVNLTQPGNWPLRDRLISHVRGHLHVLADLVAVAKVAEGGKFSFDDVAPGTYTLKVFQGATELASQQIEVGTKSLQLEPLALTAPSK